MMGRWTHDRTAAPPAARDPGGDACGAAVDIYLLDGRHGIEADGRTLTRPYRFLATGDPHTMNTALHTPGGLVAALREAGTAVLIDPRAKVTVGAIRSQ